MINRFLFTFLLAFLLTSSAWAKENSIGEPAVLWTKKSIVICWEKPDSALREFSKEEKTAVQSIVQSQYTLERVGIEFIGWQDCDAKFSVSDVHLLQDTDVAKRTEYEAIKKNPTANIIKLQQLLQRQAAYGYSDIGEGGMQGKRLVESSWWWFTASEVETGFFSKYPNTHLETLYLTALREDVNEPGAKINNLDKLKITSLHEFGHLAGLRHEHAREESRTDLNCYSMIKNGELKETELDSAQAYTEYDPNSIMNYCWIRLLKRHGLQWRYHFKSLKLPEIAFNLSVFGVPSFFYFILPEPNSRKVFSVLPRIEDRSLFTKKYDPKTNEVILNLKIALSAKDVQTLRSLYL